MSYLHLPPTKVCLTTADTLRLQDVSRWSMIGTRKQQSVAEHSYNVAMIAWKLAEIHDLDVQDTNDVLRYALTHDLGEIMTGDVPSVTKKYSGYKDPLEGRMSYCGVSTDTQDPLVAGIVKQADIIEAILFLKQHGYGAHAEQAMSYLTQKLKPQSQDLLRQILETDPQTLDQLDHD